jgi:manganese efflux pump family protein
LDLIKIIAIAVALAMDAFAVSIAAGVTLKETSFRQVFRLSWHFGLFQALMPVVGWTAGMTVRTAIERYDHWVAFILLAFVGCNMIREAMGGAHDDADAARDPTRGMTMVMLSVATSIDALAVGLSLSMLNIAIWTPALVIGLVAGLFTITGMHLGKRIARAAYLSRYAEIIGGIVLLGIGAKILHDHGVLAV